MDTDMIMDKHIDNDVVEYNYIKPVNGNYIKEEINIDTFFDDV